MEGHPFAAQVGEPERDSTGVARPGGKGRAGAGTVKHRPGPVDEEGAGVARSPDEHLPGRGVGHGPQPGHLDPRVGDHPDDQGGTEDDQYVPDVVGAGHDLVAEGVDGATGDHGVQSSFQASALLRRPGRSSPAPWPVEGHGREPGRVDAEAVEELLVPAAGPEEASERGHHRCVDDGVTRQGVGGHRLGGPVPVGIGHLLGRPGEEALGVGHGPGLLGGWHRHRLTASAQVSVQEPRRAGDAPPVDPGQGRHHAGHTDAGDVDRACHRLLQGGEGTARTAAPRRPGVVLHVVGGGVDDPVGDARAGQDLTAVGHRQRLHRRGPDVDADGDRPPVVAGCLARARGHGSSLCSP